MAREGQRERGLARARATPQEKSAAVVSHDTSAMKPGNAEGRAHDAKQHGENHGAPVDVVARHRGREPADSSPLAKIHEQGVFRIKAGKNQIVRIEKETERGKTVYEAVISKNGKETGIEVDQNGKYLNTHDESKEHREKNEKH